MPRFVLALATVALSVYAIVDCVTTPSSRMNHLPKPVWLLLVIVLPIAGPVAWLVLGKNRSEPGRRVGIAAGERSGPGASGRAHPTRPIAPDDDAEFLAQLERDIRRERIHKEREQRKHDDQREASERRDRKGKSSDAPEDADGPQDPKRPLDPPEEPPAG